MKITTLDELERLILLMKKHGIPSFKTPDFEFVMPSAVQPGEVEVETAGDHPLDSEKDLFDEPALYGGDAPFKLPREVVGAGSGDAP